MEKFVITGGKQLRGEVTISGAKNVALKALVASCLTTDEIVIENVPRISDFHVMAEIIKELGGKIILSGHRATVKVENIHSTRISLDKAAEIRTSTMFLAPLLVRKREAFIPNPGGCRIGARPIDRIVDGLQKMGVKIDYDSATGFFAAQATALKGTTYRFDKNSHTGTETLLIAASVAMGKTILENAAEEPEVDELISLLNGMGAHIVRTKKRTIEIRGVERLHGASFRIKPDRNEAVTFAVSSYITGGDVTVIGIKKEDIAEFLQVLDHANAQFEVKTNGVRFYNGTRLRSTKIETTYYPGFMTDWQGPWAILMTKAHGESVIHETVYENRFGYAEQLRKMGVRIELFNPLVENPDKMYNFNIQDDKKEYFHAAKIFGPTRLHNAIVAISDLRAGATLVLGALGAHGESVVSGIEHIDRGYEKFDERLRNLGADIKRIQE